MTTRNRQTALLPIYLVCSPLTIHRLLHLYAQRIMAVLRFDSAQLPLSVGRRSGSSAEQQLLFTAETLDLEVRITQSGSLWEVSGQVLNADARGLAELQGPAGEVRATLNEVGEFLLTPVPPGQYVLILQLDDGRDRDRWAGDRGIAWIVRSWRRAWQLQTMRNERGC